MVGKSGDVHITYNPETGMCRASYNQEYVEFPPGGSAAQSVDNLMHRLSDLDEGELLSNLVNGNGEYSFTLHGYSDSVWTKIKGY